MVANHRVSPFEPGQQLTIVVSHGGHPLLVPACVTSAKQGTIVARLARPAQAPLLNRHDLVQLCSSDGQAQAAHVLTRLSTDRVAGVVLNLAGEEPSPVSQKPRPRNERAHQRVAASNLYAHIFAAGTDDPAVEVEDEAAPMLAQVLDLSAGGARLLVPAAFQADDRVRLELLLQQDDGKAGKVFARVARVQAQEAEWLVGLQFFTLTRQASAVIERIVFRLRWQSST